MKTTLPLMLIAILAASCTQKKENPKDSVGGREIIELEDGKVYILKSKDHHTPQIEISISKDYFGIAQLSSDGTGVPPITVESKEGKIEVSRSWIENGKGITVTDEDGDGLADYRLIIPRDKSTGEKPLIEDIEHRFSKRERKEHPNGEQAGSGQPATSSESEPEGSDKPQPEAEGRSQ